ncbi:MAG: hypothetical protein H7146_07515 [Burkholderiaceae bacterium]|nr:hypothetical protein [Microbacteriaceae bacterium]
MDRAPRPDPASQPAEPALPTPPALACVILAHTDPEHVHRLIAALDPFPVFLHIDARVSPTVASAMTAGLPHRVTLLPRIDTGWARWENVAAEVAGYRAALATTGASHIALLTGTDYPLASSTEIAELLAAHRGRSMALIHPFPHPHWGQNGGYSRLRYRHWAFGKRMLRLPLPRRIPAGVVPAGGSQLKVLARGHARAVVDVLDAEPRLVRFWRRSWIPDETFIPTVLSTPRFVPDFAAGNVATDLWWIGWDNTARKSPPWLGSDHIPAVLARRRWAAQLLPNLFARKFSTAHSGEILDAIDAQRARPASPASASPTAQDSARSVAAPDSARSVAAGDPA